MNADYIAGLEAAERACVKRSDGHQEKMLKHKAGTILRNECFALWIEARANAANIRDLITAARGAQKREAGA